MHVRVKLYNQTFGILYIHMVCLLQVMHCRARPPRGTRLFRAVSDSLCGLLHSVARADRVIARHGSWYFPSSSTHQCFNNLD